MPVNKPHLNKTVADSRQKREQISEKVKEIKQRQQNWFREREEHVSKEKGQSNSSAKDVSTKKSSTSSASSASSLSKAISVSSAPSHDTRKQFHGWLKARTNDAPHEPPTQLENLSKISSRTFVYDDQDGHVPKTKHPVQKQPQPAEREEPTFEELHEKVMAPRNNDALADEIINRVKRDLRESRNASQNFSRDRSGASDGAGRHDAWKEKDRRRSDAMPSASSGGSTGTMSSHYCSVCGAIMLKDEYSPMLLIPCGHTVCRRCSEGKQTCASCGCTVGSKTVNIMLQQIIQDYQGRRHSDISPDNENRSRQSYSPTKYVDSAVRQRQQYQEELQLLVTRLEVLSEEQGNLQQQAGTVKTSLVRQQQQLDSITRQEAKVGQEIRELEEKREILQQHRTAYLEKCEELKNQQTDIGEKLDLVLSTIRSISQQVEKVKLLAEG